MHFQAYLLEGLVRWNEDRATAAAESAQQSGSSSYDSKLRQAVRTLGESVLQKDLVPGYARPNKFTGTLIVCSKGVIYSLKSIIIGRIKLINNKYFQSNNCSICYRCNNCSICFRCNMPIWS